MLQEYGHLDVYSILELMKKVKLPTTVESLQAQLSKECKEHEAELKSLKKELDKEKLRSLANSTMIDLAEKTFNISIRKNPMPSNQRLVSGQSSRGSNNLCKLSL